MRRFASVLFALALTVFAAPAHAQSEADVMDQIETLHGMSQEFVEAFEMLRESFYSGDAGTLADLAAYPLTVQANGEVYDVATAQDLIDNATALLTPETVDALANQSFADLIVTSEGVGLANGALWMSVLCTDDSCDEAAWYVISINN